jgi:hypothetical protein
MPKPKHPDRGGDEFPHREGDEAREAYADGGDDRRFPPADGDGEGYPYRDRDGRDREVIVEIVKRRLEGGAPPTPEAYARALKQWQRLPGAVVHDPGTVEGPKEHEEGAAVDARDS